VVTGKLSSLAASKAARSGNAGSPVTSKASWNFSRSDPVLLSRMNRAMAGSAVQSHGPAKMLP
jgi:hypothetical protein